MNLHAPQPRGRADDASLLSKAFLRAGERAGLTQKELALVLGKSEPTISRLANRTFFIEPATKEGEIALVFLRAYRALDALFGGREDHVRQWIHAPNKALGGIPRDLIKSLQGLFFVVTYLDALRGKI